MSISPKEHASPMTMLKVKPKKNPMAGKLDELRIKMAANGGATVHTRHHPSSGQEMYSPEVEQGAFGTKEEAFHHAAGLAGVKSSLAEAQEEAGEAQQGKG